MVALYLSEEQFTAVQVEVNCLYHQFQATTLEICHTLYRQNYLTQVDMNKILKWVKSGQSQVSIDVYDPRTPIPAGPPSENTDVRKLLIPLSPGSTLERISDKWIRNSKARVKEWMMS